MKTQLIAYFNTPIPRKAALATALGAVVGSTIASIYNVRQVVKEANYIFADQHERLAIYDETVMLLLEEASPETLGRLNEQLAYWQVIRGQSIRDPKH